FCPRHGLAGHVLPGGTADQPGEVSDQEEHSVAKVLEVVQLADQDGVAQVDVRRRGVETRLYPERLAGPRRTFELRTQLLKADRLFRALGQVGELLVQVHLQSGILAEGRLPRDTPG